MFLLAIKLFIILPLLFLVAVSLTAGYIRPDSESDESIKPGELLYRYIRAWFELILYALIFIPAIPLLALRESGYFRENLPSDSGDGPVIILVHGYLSTPFHWFFFRRFLRRKGIADVYAYGYPSFSGTIDEWALPLREFAEAYRERGVLLIGHSLGGLVAVRATSTMEAPAKVITIASPHAGTKMARIAITPTGRKLRPGSEEIERNIEILKSGKLDVQCYWSAFDKIIVPSESAIAPGSKSVEINGVSHAGFLFRDINPL